MPTGSHLLGRRVPLYIGAGLAIVLAMWTWVSYRTVRAAAFSVGRQHVEAVAKQMASAYETGARDGQRAIRSAANAPTFADFVVRGGTGDRAATIAAMRPLVTRNNKRFALFSLDGTPLVSYPDTIPAASLERHEELADDFARAAHGPDFGALASLRILNDSVVLPLVGAILKDSQPVGYAVLWMRVAASAQSRTLLSQLLGNDASFYIGNARGDLWSDFGGRVKQFPTAMSLDGAAAAFHRDDSTAVIASARGVEGTPLALAVEVASQPLFAPADQYLRRMTIVSFLMLTAATLGAWWLSRRITQPLQELTEVAQAISDGDLSRRLNIQRRDEIGMLASAFNVMADHVSESRHELELKVEQRTRQLNERNEDLEAFAHSVSHDLRAPLRAMHGFSQALLEDFSDTLDDTAKDYARRIAAAAQRMDVLTQELLVFSRISRNEVALGPVALDGVCHDAIGQFEADIAARNAQVTLDGTFPKVMAHRATLEQAIANLVGNALKFVAAGTVPRIRITAESAGAIVRLIVADNGIGVDAMHHARIFGVFERLHDNQQFAGTGMGLAIVRKAAERMGGRAGVESRPGTGSRFWIELKSAETV